MLLRDSRWLRGEARRLGTELQLEELHEECNMARVNPWFLEFAVAYVEHTLPLCEVVTRSIKVDGRQSL